MDEYSSRAEQKTWQVYSFGKRNVFRLHMYATFSVTKKNVLLPVECVGKGKCLSMCLCSL